MPPGANWIAAVWKVVFAAYLAYTCVREPLLAQRVARREREGKGKEQGREGRMECKGKRQERILGL